MVLIASQEVAHGLVGSREILPVSDGSFARIPAFQAHFHGTRMSADGVLPADSNAAYYVALEYAIPLGIAPAEAVCRRIINIHTIKDWELRNKRIPGVHTEGNAGVRRARSVEIGMSKSAGVTGFR